MLILVSESGELRPLENRMKTDIFANYLLKGQVITDCEKKPSLNRHVDLLDKICESLNITKLSDLCDYTDFFINIKESLLESKDTPSVASHDKESFLLMAGEGLWLNPKIALDTLNSLLAALQLADTCVLSLSEHEHITLCHEIMDALNLAQEAEELGALFNFSVVKAV